MKRIMYTLSRKRRDKLMNQLEKHNNDIQTLLGNSEKLEPLRRKRKSPVTRYFHQIRSQAQSLHTALSRAWQCEDSYAHSTQLLLEKRVQADENGGPKIDDASAIKFSVFFCHEKRPWASSSTLVSQPSDWSAVDIKIVDSTDDAGRRQSQSTDIGSRPSLLDTSNHCVSKTSSHDSNASDAGGRRVKFLEDDARSTTPSTGEEIPEIMDLCSALQKTSSHRGSLGYLKDSQERRHSVSLVANRQPSLSQMQRVLSLNEILGSKEGGKPTLPRRTRLDIAVILANSMLQLHTGPWLCDTWGKGDVYFLQGDDGFIHTKYPFLICQFNSNHRNLQTESGERQLQRSTSGSCNSSLLSLGILILELWFNQTIETQPFRSNFQGPDGKDNEYTNFNTAQKWQEQAMEEAGLDLHSPTRRCIYCAFGAVSQDLEDEGLRRAVYSEVVQPLEKLLDRFDGAL